MNDKPEPIEDWYLKRTYGSDIKIFVLDNKNLGFDWIIWDKNLFLKIEKKCRYFNEETKWVLDVKDILVELIQTIPSLQVPGYEKEIHIELDYSILYIGKFHSAQNAIKAIHQAIGWLYKCNADRLIFFRYFNSKLYDVIDLDWLHLKMWIFNSFENILFNLQHSNKTTQTLNISIPLEIIPKPFIYYKIIKWKKE